GAAWTSPARSEPRGLPSGRPGAARETTAGRQHREDDEMKIIPLATHELPQPDYSLIELGVQRRGGILQAAAEGFTTPQGAAFARLTEAAVSFDETQTDADGLERLLNAYGFRRRMA